VTTLIILLGAVDQIQQYAGFTLTLFSALAVSCVIVLRIRRPEMPRPFKAWGYPWTPLAFLAITGWTMGWNIINRPRESSLGLLTVLMGGLVVSFRRSEARTTGTQNSE
jgi:APA family basic amino acid/polyamine antiporter